MGAGQYILLRCALWFVGIAAAAFPAYFAGGFFTVNLFKAARLLNEHNLFRDIFYLIVIASVLAIGNLLEFMAKFYKQAPPGICGIAIFTLLFFIIALAIGFVGFTDVPVGGKVSQENLDTWTWIILVTLVVSLVVEFVMGAIDPPKERDRMLFRRYS